MTRDERITQIIEKRLLGVTSSGTVEISYRSEYSFGFDLAPDQFNVLPTQNGIEINVGKPKLVANPGIFSFSHKVLDGGVLTKEKAAIIRLQEGASIAAAKQGEKLVEDPAIAALCEKKLIEFLGSFLAKQPGVGFVPHIFITYR